MRRRIIHLERVLECFSLSIPPNCCICTNSWGFEEGEGEGEEDEEERVLERKALVASHLDQVLKLKDIVEGTKTLAFHLEPKVN